MNERRVPGFHPLNAYLWDGGGARLRFWMLFMHARFIPSFVRRTVQTWRINRTPGPRWSYPWE